MIFFSQQHKAAVKRKHGNRVNEVASILYPELNGIDIKTTLSDNSKSAKFIIVRHPFYRLVSAYRDKMERILAAK